MNYYENLINNRKLFLNQVHNLVINQFKEQEKLNKLNDIKEIIQELDSNPNYIQRIFIDAPWGMGKTYFAKALKNKFEEENLNKIEFISINAWETDYFSDPMKSLIGEINSEFPLNSETIKITENLLKNTFKAGGKIFANFMLKKLKLNNEDINALKEIFTGINTSELDDYKKYKKLVEDFKEALSNEKNPKVILIDELDRCKPNYAIELLETVKHFFGVKNIIFIFLVNKEQLKSIISTSYLTEDKASEYFEKFFDIQFKLPEFEYDDFINIEYSKYDNPTTYEVENNKSDDNTKIYEKIFLDAFTSNCDSYEIAPRTFLKSFKKFKLILLSLSDEEKSTFPLMIILILYFIKEEFFNDKSINENTQIWKLFAKTFFQDINESELLSLETEIDSINKKRLKNFYNNTNSYYHSFLKFLYNNTNNQITPYPIILIESTPSNLINLEFKLINNTIIFKSLYDYLGYTDSIETFFLQKNLFLTKTLEKNKINNSIYHNKYMPEILEAWAKEKYEFTMNILK